VTAGASASTAQPVETQAAPASTPDLTERVLGLARALGFDLAGVAPALPSERTRFLADWLARGYGGELGYLARRADERIDPRRILPGARSLLCVALAYGGDESPAEAPAPDRARVARYAKGDDYHDVLGARLRTLADALPALAGRPVETLVYVDTGPILERAHGARAGLGFVGKNTCLIHPELGSWLFLGVALTDLALEPGEPIGDHCGSCRACLDACPTGAFPEPYVLDATRCLAYATIELAGEFPPALRPAQDGWVFGCDVCQEVCPWNTRPRRRVPSDPLGLHERLAPRPAWRAPTLAWLLDLDEDDWLAATRGSALRRAEHRRILRNALVAAGESGDPALRPALERHARSGDPLVAEHARTALARLA
jgi:epoxyqueuosine reductase